MALLDVLSFVMRHPLNRGMRFRALQQFLSWQLSSRLVPGGVLFDWIEGSRLIVRPGQTGLTGNIYCGLQEFAEMGYLLHVLRPGDLFVDIGANLGSYTILASAVVGADTICVEPVPDTYAALIENVRVNGAEERVTCIQAAVGAREGTSWFSTGLGPGNHMIQGAEGGAGGLEVETMTLDRLLEGVHPALIKIDVEGFETEVIEGGAETLSRPSLHSVIMELNGSGNAYGFDEDRVLQTMRAHGFSLCTYDPLQRRVDALPILDPALDNCIFIRDVALARARTLDSRQYQIRGHML
ncbi:FkbM family methyltransferase [Luteimonas vadosa]|uniref:Methyltransferase FkbM domain-containing protein n=1 Tax=Luteimonas vadosa TaxID=1165507 RepID=A0ABP9DNN6_9GAMM